MIIFNIKISLWVILYYALQTHAEKFITRLSEPEDYLYEDVNL